MPPILGPAPPWDQASIAAEWFGAYQDFNNVARIRALLDDLRHRGGGRRFEGRA